MHLGTRSLTLSVAGISRTGDVSDCRIVSGPLTWRPRVIGGPDREYRLQGRAAQDPGAGSLWDLVWSRVNEWVEVDLRPAGGVTVSEAQPSFSGFVRIAEPDGDLLGGTAAVSLGARFTFEFDWVFRTRPVRLVG